MSGTVTLGKAIAFTIMFIALELLLGFGANALITEIKAVVDTAGLIVVLILDLISMCTCLAGLILTWTQYFKKN